MTRAALEAAPVIADLSGWLADVAGKAGIAWERLFDAPEDKSLRTLRYELDLASSAIATLEGRIQELRESPTLGFTTFIDTLQISAVETKLDELRRARDQTQARIAFLEGPPDSGGPAPTLAPAPDDAAGVKDRAKSLERITRELEGKLFSITHESSDRIIAEHQRRLAEIEALRVQDGSNAEQVDQLIVQSAAVRDAQLAQLRAKEVEAAEKVRAGLFDGAEIAISFVSWDDADGHGEVRLRRGTLGETRLTPQGYFHAELRGLSQPLAQSTLEVFSPNCRADLGDQRCKFPIEPPELARDQTVSEGTFYRVPTGAGTDSARYEDRIYEVVEAGTTDTSQPAYDTAIGAVTTDGTAVLKAYDSFTRVASVESVIVQRIFTVSEDLAGFADGWFDEGAITFETGANTGRTIEVKSWTQATAPQRPRPTHPAQHM